MIHLFTVHNLIVFSIFRIVQPSTQSISQHFHNPPAKTPYALVVTSPFPPIFLVLSSHQFMFYLYKWNHTTCSFSLKSFKLGSGTIRFAVWKDQIWLTYIAWIGGGGGGNDGEPRSRDQLGSCRMSQMRKYGSLHQGVKMEIREWMEKINLRDSIGWAW